MSKKFWNLVAFFVLIAFAGAQGAPPSSKPSSPSKPPSSSNSSRSPSRSESKPKYTAPKTEDKPKPKYTAPKTEDKPKPKYTAPKTEDKPKPKYTAPKTEDKPKPKYTAPPSGASKPIEGSKKPVVDTSDKSRAQKVEQSKRIYVESKKATLPPKPNYTDSKGRTVKVDTQSKVAERIRNQPSHEISRERREQRINVTIQNNNYSRPYNWYCEQPHVYVGGGYSSAFFWIMMTEWSAERRAYWLYHHQHELDRDAYERGLRDARTAQLVAEMNAKKLARDRNYVDKDFANDPSLIYDQEYVEAVYNPTVVEQTKKSSDLPLTILLWIAIIVVVATVVYLLVFRIKWGK